MSSVDVVRFVPGKVVVLLLAGSITTPRSKWWFCVRKTEIPDSSSRSAGEKSKLTL